MISGGRDRKIFMADVRFSEKKYARLLCEESAPILKMVMLPDQSSIWVATSDSYIKNWVFIIYIFLQIKSKNIK